MPKIRVVMVDDHTLFRQGLRMLLETQTDMEVVAEATEGGEGLEKARQFRPDVVLMDITMEGMDGLTATKLVRQDLPETKVLILTMHGSDDYFFRALAVGASGYLLKEAASVDVLTAIRTVHQGGVFLYPSLAKRLVEDYLQRMATGEELLGYKKLTGREHEILKLIAEGNTNQQIADMLTLSIHTVQSHRSNIMDKLNLQNRAELMKYAVRMGFLRGQGSP